MFAREAIGQPREIALQPANTQAGIEDGIAAPSVYGTGSTDLPEKLRITSLQRMFFWCEEIQFCPRGQQT